MSMKIGLIVLTDDHEELNKAYDLLSKKGFNVKKGDLEETETKELYVPTGPELKAAMLELQELNGNDALVDFLKTHGATSPKTLKKSEWATAYAELNELNNVDDTLNEPDGGFDGLGDGDADDLFGGGGDDLGADDLFGDDLGADIPDPEKLKIAIQKFAQKNGKVDAIKILSAGGLKTVRGLKNASDDALLKIQKALSAS